jgi:hypothetical protein
MLTYHRSLRKDYFECECHFVGCVFQKRKRVNPATGRDAAFGAC